VNCLHEYLSNPQGDFVSVTCNYNNKELSLFIMTAGFNISSHKLVSQEYLYKIFFLNHRFYLVFILLSEVCYYLQAKEI